MERRKNAAAYMTSLSAVKKIQKAKSGIEMIRLKIPAQADQIGFLLKASNKKAKMKTIS